MNTTLVISHILEANILYLLVIAIASLTSLILRPHANLTSMNKYIRLLTPISFLVSFYLHLVVSYFYMYNFKWASAFSNEYIIEVDTPLVYFQRGSISLDFFALVLITLAYIVGFISLTSISDKVF